MVAARIVKTTAFVDWNSQIHAAQPGRNISELSVALVTLTFVGRLIGRGLAAIDAGLRYDVTLRIYHGWYRGFEATPRRRALTQVAAAADFPALSTRSNVSIRPEVQFGDQLIGAAESRLHARLGCHLPNTLRKSLRDDAEVEEKMVDTALASDVVDLAHRERDRWLVIVADDDDIVPPVFTADGVRGRSDGRVLLIRNRADTPFLKLHDLRC